MSRQATNAAEAHLRKVEAEVNERMGRVSGGQGGLECATGLTDGSMATGLMSAKLERVLKTSLKRDKDIPEGHHLI